MSLATTDLRALYRAVRDSMLRRWECARCGTRYRRQPNVGCGACCTIGSVAETPADRTSWFVLADAIEESGDPALAVAWRWLVASDRWPSLLPNRRGRNEWDWYRDAAWEYHRFANIRFLDALDDKGKYDGWYETHRSPFHAFVRLAEAIRDQRPREVYGDA